MLNSTENRAAGALNIQVQVDQQQVIAASSELTRPLQSMQRLLLKQGPVQACQMLPLLFAVCGEAHALAGKLACGLFEDDAVIDGCDNNNGGTPEGSSRRNPTIQRALAGVLRENLREHLMQLRQFWHLPLPAQAFAEAMKEISFAMERGDDVARSLAVEALLVQLERNIHQQQWLPQLQDSLQQQLAGVVLPDNEVDSWQACQPGLMPEPGRVFSGAGADALLHHAGRPLAQALLAVAQQQWQATLRVMEALMQAANPHDWVRCHRTLDAAGQPVQQGWVRTARGWLLHQVRQNPVANGTDATAAGWLIQAPTDVNFQGPLVTQCLTGMSVPNGTVDKALRWIVRALDPCVGFDIEICELGIREPETDKQTTLAQADASVDSGAKHNA